MRSKSLARRRAIVRFARAFTLIELLVVITIIIILLGSVLVAGNAMLGRAKIRNTRAVLHLVDSALDEFQRQKPSILGASQATATGGMVLYRDRYGNYPPDETEMFTPEGLPGSTGGSLSVGMAEFVPAPTAGSTYPAMRFYTAGNARSEFEHRDLIAMVLAIEMYCEPAAMILSRVPDSNRWDGLFDSRGDPLQFLEDANSADQMWNRTVDRQLPPAILDSWGKPLSYMSQRDYTGNPEDIPSNNAAGWNQASTEMIRLNSGRPIIMSWGADGRDQLTKDAQQDPTASLVGDWDDNQRIDNPFNEDNVYLDETLNEKLATGL